MVNVKFVEGKIKLRQYAVDICDVFEEILDQHGIEIPDEDREGDEDEAPLYGSTYSYVESCITDILNELVVLTKQHPDAEVDMNSY